MAQWYIRMRGRTLGPFSWDKMLELRDSRQLQAFHEVSVDNRSWQTAGSIENLFPTSKIVARPSAMVPAPVAAQAVAAPVRAAPTKRSFPWVWLIVGGVCLMIFVLCGGIAGLLYYKSHSRSGLDDRIAEMTTSGVIGFDSHTDLAEKDRLMKEVVGLVITGWEVTSPKGVRTEEIYASGSCFVVTKDGYLLTNLHVVEQVDQDLNSQLRKDFEAKNLMTITPKIWVFFGRDDKSEAQIFYMSHDYDLAILKINRKSNHFLALSSKNPAEIPRDLHVAAYGFPGADRVVLSEKEHLERLSRQKSARYAEQNLKDRDFDFSLRDGKINVLAHDVNFDQWPKPINCVQHSAEIHHGNSGGPLVLDDGTVIGINTWKGSGKDDLRVYFSMTLPQLRKDIDKVVPNAIWR
jgi:S1-C subfamily serine protease